MSIYESNVRRAVEAMQFLTGVKPDPLEKMSPEVKNAAKAMRYAAGLDENNKLIRETSNDPKQDSNV